MTTWEVNIHDLPQDFEFLSGETHPFVLGPKRDGGYPFWIDTQTLESVREHKYHLFTWGWVTYRDVFPNSHLHLTEFCEEIYGITVTNSATNTVADLLGPNADIRWGESVCRMHNCYDEECKDYAERTNQAPVPKDKPK